MPAGTISLPIHRIRGSTATVTDDLLAVEEPLEIRVVFDDGGARTARSLSITMRTPGEDAELAAGFLFTEGIVGSAKDLDGLKPCGPIQPWGGANIVRVELSAGVAVDLVRLQRNFYTSSSCGVCGKASLDALEVQGCSRPAEGPVVSPTLLHGLPLQLRAAQANFDATGGLHAAGLFDANGHLIALREDVGRHNAVDKVIGARLLAGAIPLSDCVLVLSGRASFEILQKALVAGIPFVAAVGAPSSLAVQLASRWGMTLVGFLRDGRFNVYTGMTRVDLHTPGDPCPTP